MQKAIFAEVGDELVLRAYLQVVARLGLPVVHRVFLHPHESGVGIGLAAGVAPVHRFEAAVVQESLSAICSNSPTCFCLWRADALRP